MKDRDLRKLTKASFATPRGGAKNAYQNHVTRSSQVIVPHSRLTEVPLADYHDGVVVRLSPEECFASPGTLREVPGPTGPLVVGRDAFVLYRTHEQLERFPPLDGWDIRGLEKNGRTVKERGRGVLDVGHYVLRIPRKGALQTRIEGPPQGIFAPEYAPEDANYLAKLVLAWLITRTMGVPYGADECKDLERVLDGEGLTDAAAYEQLGVLRGGVAVCPLCQARIHYDELHEMIDFADIVGHENAPDQVEGATRSTKVNLFHLRPLTYREIRHRAGNVAWGHAICNTRLGQRDCYSLGQIHADGHTLTTEDGARLGWLSGDQKMIRSATGAVWIQLNADLTEAEADAAAELTEGLEADDG